MNPMITFFVAANESIGKKSIAPITATRRVRIVFMEYLIIDRVQPINWKKVG